MNPNEVQMYEVDPGRILAGEYPASWESELALKRLEFVVDRGVSTFINLTTRDDRLEPYAELLSEIDPSLEHLSFPIPDMDVPESDEVMRGVLEAIDSETKAGRMCYVHCWGGIGRTGTVIGCYFRDQGMSGEEALSRVQKLYSEGMPKVAWHPHSPQTRAQCDYVRDWVG